MLSYLRGNLLGVEGNRILLEVHGVGFEVAVPSGLLQQLPAPGEEVSLFTHLQVREDDLQLFGFASRQDRALFRLLLKTQGIGPRVALTILDTVNAAELAEIIARGDGQALLRIPGIGKKSAQRLLLELKDKLSALPEIKAKPAPARGALQEVAEALLALGYNRQEADGVLNKLQEKGKASLPADGILKEALRELGKGKRE